MTALLHDKSKFPESEGEKDKTPSTVRRCAKRLKQDGLINSGQLVPKYHGLPNVYRDEIPLRSIFDMDNPPYHDRAKRLAEIIEPMKKKIARFTLCDTVKSVDLIDPINVPDKRMYSFDVCLPFTNVPLEETIEYVENCIENSGKFVGLLVQELKRLIRMSKYNIQFRIHGCRYRQKDELAMVSGYFHGKTGNRSLCE